jgi:hypothetical protein
MSAKVKNEAVPPKGKLRSSAVVGCIKPLAQVTTARANDGAALSPRPAKMYAREMFATCQRHRNLCCSPRRLGLYCTFSVELRLPSLIPPIYTQNRTRRHDGARCAEREDAAAMDDCIRHKTEAQSVLEPAQRQDGLSYACSCGGSAY